VTADCAEDEVMLESELCTNAEETSTISALLHLHRDEC
jgi:hypothetical protein